MKIRKPHLYSFYCIDEDEFEDPKVVQARAILREQRIQGHQQRVTTVETGLRRMGLDPEGVPAGIVDSLLVRTG